MTACSRNSSAAYLRYKRRFMPATALYVMAIGLATWLIPDNAHASALTIGIALLPGIATLLMIWAMARLLLEIDDEFLRLLEIRKALAATGLMLSVASVWGLLELYTDVPRLPVFFIFPLWCLSLMVGQLWNRREGL